MKFLLTRELGRLARWLRILGFDASYVAENNLSSVVINALRDNRIILTRNHRLPESRGIRVVVLSAEILKEQLQEVLQALDISLEPALMFSRCIICNEELVAAKKEKIKDKVPEYVYKTQEDFMSCPKCNRVYWQGTHWGHVQEILKEVQ